MKKKLSELSLEELWKLFPIMLTSHQSCWKDWYLEEKNYLTSILISKEIVSIHHIGSTAIPTIWAKPIIDILVELTKDSDMEAIKERLEQKEYICMLKTENRMSLNKGYTEEGYAKKVFHIHLRFDGDHDEVYFRDYLIDNPSVANEYEKLKLGLWEKYEYNRDGYTKAKTEFVEKYTKYANSIYCNMSKRGI